MITQHKKLILTVVGLFLTAAAANAQEPATHTARIGTEISHITYEESNIKEKGMMYGLTGSYTQHPATGDRFDNAMLRVEGRLAFGQVDYDGQLQDGTPYEVSDINDFIGEIRGLGGYDFSVCSSTTLTPYFGFGYRYLFDELSKDVAGYDRESNYFYSPIGVETRTSMANGWSMGARVEYDIFWFGKQKSHLSDVSPLLSDVTNDQKEGYGIRGSITVRKEMEMFNIAVSPFVRYWSIDKSEESTITYSGSIIGTAVEPENTSTEYGITLAVEF